MALSPYRRFRLNRRMRRVRRFFKEQFTKVSDYFNAHVIERFSALREARRFAIGWLALIGLLAGGIYIQGQYAASAYITDGPTDGGTYIEGVVGNITNLNPIFATGRANTSASRLIFSGLFSYDKDGKLVPALAKDYSVNEAGTEYTVTLKDDITFHDGSPVRSRDVLFTIRAMQRPDTRSPFQSSWRDIEMTVKDNKTIVFTLPNAFSPFPHSLTVGILPSHLLEGVSPGDLRADSFNTDPIGAGPFRFERLVTREGQQNLELRPNENYFAGEPRVNAFTLRAFEDYDSMINAYKNAQVSAISGLRTFDLDKFKNTNLVVRDIPLTSQVYTFFNNSRAPFKNANIRKALTLLINKKQLIEKTNFMFAPTQSPLLQEQLGYSRKLQQAFNNQKRANKLLKDEGFTKKGGIYQKNGNQLGFTLVTQNTDEYPEVAKTLQSQWKEQGVAVNVELIDPNDLQQGYVQPHAYEALLFGITLGADSDVFAFWHSSQASQGGFNLSEYSSEIADEALEAGRTRLDRQIRAAKYKTFVRQWLKDNPAAVLYRPQYLYGSHPKFSGILPNVVVEPSDRFNNVETWTIRQAPTEKSF